MKYSDSLNLIKTIVIILIPLIIGFIIGSLFKPSDEWRERIKNPDLIPPGYVFSIVWSILYIMIGFILHRIIANKNRLLLAILIINLIFNYLFTPIQFGLINLELSAFIVFLTLLSALYLSIELFKNKYYIEFWMSIAYVTWLTFAMILSISAIL